VKDVARKESRFVGIDENKKRRTHLVDLRKKNFEEEKHRVVGWGKEHNDRRRKRTSRKTAIGEMGRMQKGDNLNTQRGRRQREKPSAKEKRFCLLQRAEERTTARLQ